MARIRPSPAGTRTEANPMSKIDDAEKVARFQAALTQLTERIAEDR